MQFPSCMVWFLNQKRWLAVSNGYYGYAYFSSDHHLTFLLLLLFHNWWKGWRYERKKYTTNIINIKTFIIVINTGYQHGVGELSIITSSIDSIWSSIRYWELESRRTSNRDLLYLTLFSNYACRIIKWSWKLSNIVDIGRFLRRCCQGCI